MSEEQETIPSPARSHGKLGCGCAVVGLIAAGLIVPTSGRSEWIFQFIYHLGVGWLLHSKQCIERLGPDLPQFAMSAVLPVLAASGAVLGFHRLAGWWMQERGVPAAWRLSQSVVVGFLVLLGSAAAIALSGVLHELAWLPQGEIIRNNLRTTQTLAVNNARQLGMAIFEYETEFERLPMTLKDLDRKEYGWNGHLPRMTHMRFNSSSPPEPFILLNPGGQNNPDPNSVILISPLIPDAGKFVVLKSDMSVTSLPAARLAEVLKSGKTTVPVGK